MSHREKPRFTPSTSAVVRELRHRAWSDMRDLATRIVDDPIVADAVVERAFRSLRRQLRNRVTAAGAARVLSGIVTSIAIDCSRSTRVFAGGATNDNGSEDVA